MGTSYWSVPSDASSRRCGATSKYAWKRSVAPRAAECATRLKSGSSQAASMARATVRRPAPRLRHSASVSSPIRARRRRGATQTVPERGATTAKALAFASSQTNVSGASMSACTGQASPRACAAARRSAFGDEAQGHALPVSVRDRRAGPRAVVLEDAHGPGAAPRGQRVEAVAREVTSSPAAAGEGRRGPRCGPAPRRALPSRRAPRGGRPRRWRRRARGRWETRSRTRAPSTRRRSSPWPGPRCRAFRCPGRTGTARRRRAGPASRTDCRRASRASSRAASAGEPGPATRRTRPRPSRGCCAARSGSARRLCSRPTPARLRIACSAVMLSNCTASIEHC